MHHRTWANQFPKTEKWVDEHLGDLMALAIHLHPRNVDGSITIKENICDNIITELLSDILEVWEDKHKTSPKDCEECLWSGRGEYGDLEEMLESTTITHQHENDEQ